MHTPLFAQRLLDLLDPGAPPAAGQAPGRAAVDADSADETALARTHGLLRARDGSPPARLVEDHTRLRAGDAADVAADRMLGLALAAYTSERERSRRAGTDRTLHDLRNALGAITMTAQRWLRAPLPTVTRDDAALVLRQATQLQSLLEGWRIRQEPAPGPDACLTLGRASLAAECRESLVELRAAHPGLGIAFEAAAAATARFDAARLREALGHLVARYAQRGARSVAVQVWSSSDIRVGLTVAAEGAADSAAPERRGLERLAWLAVRQTAHAHGGDVRDDGHSATLWLPAEPA